jgi:UDP-GlcNAc:undecaprenyl-phosphate/decaprenyl-phosphate GlcNAc-1-phosphate transferase
VKFTQYAILIAVACIATLVLTPIVRNRTVKRGLVDRPGGRKVHEKEISRLGGVAIFGGFCAALIAEWIGETYFSWNPVLHEGGPPLWGTLAGLVVIFIVGVVDDLRNVRPGVKFAGQVLAACLPIAGGLAIDYIGNPVDGGLLQLGVLSIPITLLWIVGFTNVINLIDGLDGLAAGVSAIAATSFLLLAIQMNTAAPALIAAALIGACLGFLRYNFNPASIIMGDSGAMFLGFALGAMSLAGVMKSVAAVALAVPLLIIGIPVFDTASAIIRRWRHGRPIQEADNGHIHHRLLYRGFNQRQTVLIIYAWSIGLAGGAYAMRYVPTLGKWILFATLATLSWLMARWLGLFEAAHIHGDGER